jgi:hypothetical protein
MRTSTLVSVTFAFFAVAFSSTARAEQEFDLSIANGQVVVTAKSGWHINQDFPWKLTAGDQKLDKSKFALTASQATIAAPRGKAHLKGAVCSAGTEGKCLKFEKDIEVR